MLHIMKLRNIVGLGLVEMAISTYPKPTMYIVTFTRIRARSCSNAFLTSFVESEIQAGQSIVGSLNNGHINKTQNTPK